MAQRRNYKPHKRYVRKSNEMTETRHALANAFNIGDDLHHTRKGMTGRYKPRYRYL